MRGRVRPHVLENSCLGAAQYLSSRHRLPYYIPEARNCSAGLSVGSLLGCRARTHVRFEGDYNINRMGRLKGEPWNKECVMRTLEKTDTPFLEETHIFITACGRTWH
jgi:hypothetical protein